MMPSYEEKHYKSAYSRFMENILEQFFHKHVPQVGGKELRVILSQKVLKLVDEYMPNVERVKPGQMVWTTVDKYTRADSKKVQLNPVVLTLVNEEDIHKAERGEKTLPGMLPETIARVLNEAHEQGSLLSMRDLALIFKRFPPHISTLRKKYEEANNVVLPTVASMQDVGSGVTHKTMIIRKVLLEHKDMAKVREETKHTQGAIDRYLKDFRRVEMLFDDGKETDFIKRVTGMRAFLIKQYYEIYKELKMEVINV